MSKRIISYALSFSLAFAVVFSNMTIAKAADVVSGGLSITATNSADSLLEGTDFEYSDGKWTISTTTPVTLSMKTGVEVTDDCIVIDTVHGDANVTFSGINIKSDEQTIVEIEGENSTMITVKGQNSIVSTSTSNAEGIYSEKSPLKITGTEGGLLSFSGIYSAIEGYKAGIDLEGNWKLKVTDAKFGVYLSPYSSSSYILNIGDNVSIEMSEIDEHAIYNKYGKINMKADSGEHIDINTTTDAWCIYGHGIDISGKVTITAKSIADDGAIYSGGEDNPINISGDVVIDIESVKNGLTAKGDISIEDADIDIACTNTYAYGINCNDLVITDSKVDIESTGYAAITADAVTISGNTKLVAKTEVDTTSSRYGIMYEGKLDVSDSAEVDIKVIGKKTYAIYGSSSNKTDTVNVCDNAKVTLDGGIRTIYYVETISLSDHAEMTIKNAEEEGVYKADINVSGNAKLTVESKEYGVRVENCLAISNNAEVLINGADKAIYSSNKYKATPDSGKAYEVFVGKTKDTATLTTYYDTSGEQSTKTGMTYFYAVSKTPYQTPDITIDYKKETLNGFKEGAKYTENGEGVTPENGELPIKESWFGTTLQIMQKGDTTYAASKAQEVVIAARPDAPIINGEYEISEKNNKKFVYEMTLIENAEYKMDDGKWQDSNVFDEITPTSKHVFSARIKATENSFAGEIANTEEIIFKKLNGKASVSMKGWTVGETPSEPIPESKTNGTEKVSYLYKLSGEDDSKYSNTKPTEPGKYIVKAVFEATDVYDEVEATTEFTIVKALASPETGDFTKVWMLYALLFISGLSIVAVKVYEKKAR